MGLAERRVTEEIKNKFNETWLKQIHATLKTPVAVEVEWDTIVKEGQTGYAVEAFEKVFVKSLIEGFDSICRDEMGASAVKDGIKKIVIKNVSGSHHSEKWAALEGGVLTVDHCFANIDEIKSRANALVKVLEKGL